MPVKPTTQEETFFARQEHEKRRKAAEDAAARLQKQTQEEQKQLHWMRCPKCGSELAEVGYREQRVDRCQACGGVWLDAGELEALAAKEGGFLLGLRKAFQG